MLFRSTVVFGLAWLVVLGGGAMSSAQGLSSRTWWLLGGSGLATGLSWLCYMRALQMGPVSRVAPLDKLSVVLTVLAVAGIANSINIIDGFNGLASMCSVIMMAAIAYVAFQVGDQSLMIMALAGIGAVLGFFLWNFPAGYIFLGDGGAYFLGFYVAELGILLLDRNPQVSPMFPLLVCIYPVFETVFSIYRRVVVRGRKASMPDGIHLHSQIGRAHV